MHHMARGEEAEAMKGGQGSVTGARALGLCVAMSGLCVSLYFEVGEG